MEPLSASLSQVSLVFSAFQSESSKAAAKVKINFLYAMLFSKKSTEILRMHP